MGKLIVMEGLDGSGKGTQSKLLAQFLKIIVQFVVDNPLKEK
ncbi:hypothetical protein [Desulfosporosinus youngiae]|uniref:Thymidylate kinase n=1 Tax=Desulfosporosinus youngiae DSM 17734 TaxID=768710 RepID=H5XZG3_9FIRM|nr:hypothetical protein [Desulfosporosinus youngiae]EHQ91869.1 hypothetical protein DesyoDRAFT_4929 [Desulfosporosinus youngiae DSM 17734]